MTDTSTADAPPVFGPDGKMQGNQTSAQGQPPAPPFLQDQLRQQEGVMSSADALEARYQSALAPQKDALSTARKDYATAAANRPNEQPLPPAPDAKEYQKDAMAFASAMAVLGAVTSHFGRASGGAALNAFAGALKGWQTGNLQAYDQDAKKWEQDTKTTIENNRQLLAKYDQILKNKALNIDQMMAQISETAVENHHDMMYQASKSGNYTMVAQIRDKIWDYTDGPKGAQATMDKLKIPREKEEEQMKALAVGVISGRIDPNGVNPQTGQPWSDSEKLHFKYAVENYGPLAGKAISKAPTPGSPAELITKRRAEREAAGQPPETSDQEAAYVATLKPPRSAAGMSLQRFKEENPNATSADIQEFQAKQAEMNSAARAKGGREANLDIILRVTDSAIPAAIEASEKVPRGSFVPVNKIIQQGKIATSDPALMQFGMANLQLAEGWARAMNPTGVMRESDREKALSFLSTATSQETYKVLVHQLQTQIQRERAAIQSGKQSTVSAPGETPSTSESTGAGWTDLGGGVRIREKQ